MIKTQITTGDKRKSVLSGQGIKKTGNEWSALIMAVLFITAVIPFIARTC